MSVDIIIPVGGDDVYRNLNLQWVMSHWGDCGYTVLTGECDSVWSKGAAVAAAVEVSSADVLVITDGDVWTNDVFDAIRVVESGSPWAVPFGSVHRLNEASTSNVLNGGALGGKLLKPPYRAVPGGGMVVLTRELYLQAPIDPRFVGWGHEDEAWGHALFKVAGEHRRFRDPLFHLWHPPAERDRALMAENANLRNRYIRARRREGEMEQLLAGAREALGW